MAPIGLVLQPQSGDLPGCKLAGYNIPHVCFVCVRQQIGTFGTVGFGPPTKQTHKHTHSVEFKALSVATVFNPLKKDNN